MPFFFFFLIFLLFFWSFFCPFFILFFAELYTDTMRFAEGNISDQISVILRAGTHGGSGGPTVRQHRRDPPLYTDTPRPPVQPSRVGDPDPSPAYPDRVLPGPGGRESPALAPPARSGLGWSRYGPARPGPARLQALPPLPVPRWRRGGCPRALHRLPLRGERRRQPGDPGGGGRGCLHRSPPCNNRAFTRDAEL